jgi:hypothetical protein
MGAGSGKNWKLFYTLPGAAFTFNDAVLGGGVVDYFMTQFYQQVFIGMPVFLLNKRL